MENKINREQVRHVATLARLELTEPEELRMTEQMNSILSYMDKLNELDTSEVPPTSHMGKTETVFREDVVGNSLPVDEALQNAPDRVGTYYRVPKIIE